MGDFGKRGRQSAATSRHTASARQESAAAPPDLISKRDLKYIDKGYGPAWANLSRLQLMVFVLLLPALALAAIWCYGPDIVRDLRYAGTFTVATDLRATEGKCTRHAFMVTLCSAKIRSMRGEAERSSAFMMFFRSGDGAQLVPVRSTANASVVGIRYAVSDVLINRTLSLLGGTMFFGWIWLMLFDCVRKGRYKGGPAHAALVQYMALRSQPA